MTESLTANTPPLRDQAVEPTTRSGWARADVGRVAWWAALLAPPILYLGFVFHYSVNVIFYDEWDVVPLVNAELHHRLTLGMLWAQHNESRVFTANIVFVLFGRFDHYDTRSIILFAAVLSVITYLLLLWTYRRFAGRRLAAVPMLLIGLVWFSLVDWQNSLWSFQVAWYLLALFFVGMVFALSWMRSAPKIALICAVVLAVGASVSVLQGLAVWPVGLLCVLSQARDRRSSIRFGTVWILAALATTLFYVRGFHFQSSATGGGSVAFAVRHPIGLVKFLLVGFGNVFGTTSLDLKLHEVIGLVVVVGAGWVIYQSIRAWSANQRIPLPLALVIFSAFFELSIALGRLSYGIGQALSSRYSMAAIFMVVGIGMFVFSRVPQNLREQRLTQLPVVVSATLALLLIAQVVVSTQNGIDSARSWRTTLVTSARVVVNIADIPPMSRNSVLSTYVFPDLVALRRGVRFSRADGLGMFAPGPERAYRRQGLPAGL